MSKFYDYYIYIKWKEVMQKAVPPQSSVLEKKKNLKLCFEN